MENLAKQRSVRFSGEHPSNLQEIAGLSSWLSESTLTDNRAASWLRSQIAWRRSEEQYDPKKSEYAVAVAAAAFAIDSVEGAEAERRRMMREDSKRPRGSKLKSKKSEDNAITGQPSMSGTSRSRSSTQEVKIAERSLTKKSPTTQERGPQEIASSSERSWIASEASQAAAWERTQIEESRKRYEKMRAAIVAWENEKKLAARLKLERKKSELEKRRELSQQHYRMKVSRIESIAGGAKSQLEEKRRAEESQIKERARRMRRTGKAPTTCFGFHCY